MNSTQLNMNKRDDRHTKEIPGTPRLYVGAVFDAVYGTIVTVRPVKNLAQLANGPTLHVRWQAEDICFVSSTNPYH
jgi:hypothetical protein